MTRHHTSGTRSRQRRSGHGARRTSASWSAPTRNGPRLHAPCVPTRTRGPRSQGVSVVASQPSSLRPAILGCRVLVARRPTAVRTDVLSSFFGRHRLGRKMLLAAMTPDIPDCCVTFGFACPDDGVESTIGARDRRVNDGLAAARKHPPIRVRKHRHLAPPHFSTVVQAPSTIVLPRPWKQVVTQIRPNACSLLTFVPPYARHRQVMCPEAAARGRGSPAGRRGEHQHDAHWQPTTSTPRRTSHNAR